VLSAIGALVLLAFSEYTISTSSEFGLFRCMYGFFVGYVLYRIVIAYGSPLRNTASASLAELGSVVAVVAFVSICADTPSRMFAPFVFAVAIWVFAAERGVFSRLLQCRPLVIVGLLSYSIYMSHMMIITAGNNALHVAIRLVNRSTAGSWEGLLSNEWVLDAMVVGFVMTIIGVSWCTYSFIEVPWRRRFNRMANRISPKREIEPLGVSLHDLAGTPQSVPAAE
jgi:peptidoglycan/LPS O-acetylase OafA/YrhL